MTILRKHLRTSAAFRTRLTRTNGQAVSGEVQSLSLGGAFVACNDLIWGQDESCEFSIMLSGGQVTIDGEAAVSYVRTDGVGLRFEKMDANSLEHLTKIMMLHVASPNMIRLEVKRLKLQNR